MNGSTGFGRNKKIPKLSRATRDGKIWRAMTAYGLNGHKRKIRTTVICWKFLSRPATPNMPKHIEIRLFVFSGEGFISKPFRGQTIVFFVVSSETKKRVTDYVISHFLNGRRYCRISLQMKGRLQTKYIIPFLISHPNSEVPCAPFITGTNLPIIITF